jgi:hypothetical protein
MWMERKAVMAMKLTPEIINAAIVGFEEQKRQIDARITELRAMLSGGSAESATEPEAPAGKRKKFSAQALLRMREAQQRRWAKVRGKSAPSAAASPAAPKSKSRLSEAGRAAIIAATKKRWALKRGEAAKAQSAAKKAAPAGKKAAIKKAPVKTATAKAAKKAAPVKKAKDTVPPATPAVTETGGQ